jgi:hypothetical protein
VRRYSTYEAASKAGNSQVVIEKHYKGVLDTLPNHPGAPAAARGFEHQALSDVLKSLDEVQLAALRKQATCELEARLRADR